MNHAGAIDTNLLLYAENTSSSFHESAFNFLNHLMESGVPIYLTWDVAHAYLRITTHQGIFANPLTPAEAMDNITKIIDHPSVTMLGHSLESWKILTRLTDEMHLRGNLFPDAVTASILEANAIRTIYTHDRDFWKFPALKPIDPFAK